MPSIIILILCSLHLPRLSIAMALEFLINRIDVCSNYWVQNCTTCHYSVVFVHHFHSTVGWCLHGATAATGGGGRRRDATSCPPKSGPLPNEPSLLNRAASPPYPPPAPPPSFTSTKISLLSEFVMEESAEEHLWGSRGAPVFFSGVALILRFLDLLPLTPALSPSFPSHPNISATAVVSTLGAAAEKKQTHQMSSEGCIKRLLFISKLKHYIIFVTNKKCKSAILHCIF
jgi:hypothetical protein